MRGIQREIMDINDFSYELPETLIAQEPAKERHLSRMLVIDRKTGRIEHRLFKDILKKKKTEDNIQQNMD